MSTLDLALHPTLRHGLAVDLGDAARRVWRALAPRAVARRCAAVGSREVALVADGCCRVWNAAGRRVDCHEGTAWITLDGDSRDIVLEAGESFVVDRDTAALIFALRDRARLTIGASPPALRHARRRRRWTRAALLAAAVALGVITVQAAHALGHLSAAVHLAS